MTRTRIQSFSLIGLFALVAVACGGGDTSTVGQPSDSGSAGPSASDSAEPSETASASESETGAAAANTGDGTLTIGTLLPETGSLVALGPPEVAGVRLAINEINEAGGVLGNDVELIEGDSGDTTTDIANQTVDRLLSANADAIIGAASSSVSFTVIDKIVGASVIQFSPANTSKRFTDYDDKGLFFRTAPSDILQGQVLGEIIVEDGNATVGILSLQDAYGEGLTEDATKSINDSGGEVVETVIYDPNAGNFDAEIQRMVAADPEAILVIGFDETAKIISGLIEQGIGPSTKNIYGSDGNMTNALGEQFPNDPGALEGMKGTTPLSELSDDFRTRLATVDPDLIDFNYSGEAYDAINVIALAAVIADSDEPTAIAAEINGVTKDGEKCSSFAECLPLVEAGTDIDYDGVIGPLEFTDAGEPGQGSYGILEFDADNVLQTLEFRFAGA